VIRQRLFEKHYTPEILHTVNFDIGDPKIEMSQVLSKRARSMHRGGNTTTEKTDLFSQ